MERGQHGPDTAALWTPDEGRKASSLVEAFRRSSALTAGVELADYDALHAWSVAQPEAFWGHLAYSLELPFGTQPTQIRSSDPMPRTRWFEGATLSYAGALLYPAASVDDAATAIIAVTEAATSAGTERILSFADLRALVSQVQAGLRHLGVGRGDHVVALAANVPETLALLLACSGIGAVFASASPDFGVEAASARFAQLAPKALFASVGYVYGGKRFDTTANVGRLQASLGGVPTIALPYPGLADSAHDFIPWARFLGAPGDLELLQLPFEHPLYVLFSSGTTGTPKALVHRAGGALLTHRKEHALHCDIRPGDTVFYFTTCGWMMWNWLISCLASGASVVLYDGSPAHPDSLSLFEIADRHAVTLFGTSARYLHSLAAQRERPSRRFELGALKTIASTGSPLSPSGFRYVYEHVKSDVHLASISGGTDIVGCFMLGVPTLPVVAGEIQRPGLGVDLAAYDASGTPLMGVPGELVCRQPLPSMPLALMGDPDFERYTETYHSDFPGVWRHGDLVEFTPGGGVVVHGRSDATLNPGGVRIGTADIYRALEQVAEVVEAAAVGRKLGPAVDEAESRASDEEVWLLVVLAPDAILDDELESRIRRAVRQGASPRHVPHVVLQVPGLPRTRSGKSMEMAVARLVNGLTVDNVDVMANPEVVAAIVAALAGR